MSGLGREEFDEIMQKCDEWESYANKGFALHSVIALRLIQGLRAMAQELRRLQPAIYAPIPPTRRGKGAP
jgi:hypothetical protein